MMVNGVQKRDALLRFYCHHLCPPTGNFDSDSVKLFCLCTVDKFYSTDKSEKAADKSLMYLALFLCNVKRLLWSYM